VNLRAAIVAAYVWLRSMTSDDGTIPQAATIPFRSTDAGGVEVLLIRRRGKDKWGIPKGLVDPGHKHEQTALIESAEEAGVEGALVIPPLGDYTYEKFGGTCRVIVYALRVTAARERFLEDRSRERRWFPLEEAARTVHRQDVGEMIRQLPSRAG
jgi:8-oxo-dGTP pyrophosphatase MutT (NUDIX family)